MRGQSILRKEVQLSIALVLAVILFAACSDLPTDNTTPGSNTLLHPSAVNQPNLQPTENLKLLVPLYVDPVNNRADWMKVVEAANRVNMNVIINPSGGPIGCQTAMFQEALNLLTSQNIVVLGYVPTGFGNRDMAAIKQDITNYQACSQFGGIFLDEVSRDANQVDNITELCSFIRGVPQFGRTVLNAGSQLDNRIAANVFCDTVVIFENDMSNWISSYNPKSVEIHCQILGVV